MRLRRKAEEAKAAVQEEARDEERLREAIRLRQREVERRLRAIQAQAAVVKR